MKQFMVLLAVGLLAGRLAHAQKQPCATAGNNNDYLGIQTIRLWPGDAPQARGKACEDTPTLTIFEPHRGNGNGSAVVVLPGGAYVNLAANLEGRQVADWFTSRGFRAFILSYRLSSNGYLLPVPLLDARRAIQTVRARALDYQIDPNRIVVIGFSAGGHLAALSATQFVPGNPDAEDPIDRASSRPDYLVLGYPDRRHLQRYIAPVLLQAFQRDGPLRSASDRVLSRSFRDQRHASDLLVPHLR